MNDHCPSSILPLPSSPTCALQVYSVLLMNNIDQIPTLLRSVLSVRSLSHFYAHWSHLSASSLSDTLTIRPWLWLDRLIPYL